MSSQTQQFGEVVEITGQISTAPDCAIVPPEANSGKPSKGAFDSMARKRFQRGSLLLRGKQTKKWVAKWREDVLQPDGVVRRVQRREVLGTLTEYKTKRLAERALMQRLTEVNSATYKPRPTATFREFATKWQRDVLTQLKPSTRSADRSRIAKHLIPELGGLCMKDVTTQGIQAMIAKKQSDGLSPKSVRNLIATLRIMWTQARSWGYVQHDLFYGLVLPDHELLNERFLSLDEMKRVIEAAPEPLQNLLLDSRGDRLSRWRNRSSTCPQCAARPGSHQDRPERVAWENPDRKISEGEPSL
jgi:hypothetical protein